MQRQHKAVLLQPVIDLIAPRKGGIYVDVTLGAGGHFKAIIAASTAGTFVGFDQDSAVIEDFKQGLLADEYSLLKEVGGASYLEKDDIKVILINSNFRKLEEKLLGIGITGVDAVMADLGLSTDQFADSSRGFSFLDEGELDMRMDKVNLQVKAADLVNGLYRGELMNMFEKLGDISFARELADEILRERALKPITSSLQLTNLVRKIVPSSSRKGTNKHPEAKVFQALRIAVNDELNALKDLLPQAFAALAAGGKLIIISFHSGEDRIVKIFFKELVTTEKAKLLVKIVRASQEEQLENSRSHSAKLRALIKN